MFSIEKSKIKTLNIKENSESFYNYINDNEFPVRKYIEKKYNCCGTFFYPEDIFNKDTLPFLIKNATLLSCTSVGKIGNVIEDPLTGIRGGTFWFSYKNVYVRISLRDQPDDKESYRTSSFAVPPMIMEREEEENTTKKEHEKTFNIMFAAPVTTQKFPLEDFNKFVVVNKKGNVHLFIKNQYGEYDFEPIKINCEDINLEMNYGKDFIKIHDLIINRLQKTPNGLYMFHGFPGTGKTTYIKHLANIIERDFIYVPTNMLEYFTTDPNSLAILLRRPNSILILEDAEKAILKREAGESSSVSSLLNLSDGLMSDILKTAIILTYNCPKHDIDEALRRKGRLQMDYEFKNLSKEDSIRLATHLKFPENVIEEKITCGMSLADIYNIQEEIDFSENTDSKSRIIGFGK